VARLIADTSLLISAERRGQTLESLVADDDDLAIATVTAAEMLVGLELAGARHREARRDYVERMLEDLTIEDYTLEVARAHARLLAHVRRTGRPRGVIDLIIAATAVARDRIVITADRAGFEGLPGLTIG
jgi:tRNA(fMet)-specific endonuclease VapC